MIGQTFSHYRITEKLGAGGMGEVYAADDIELERSVAIKFLPGNYSAGANELERFKREARAAASLNHPNIVTIYDIGTHEGRPYIVMERVDGEPLASLIERKDLSVDRALTIAGQICDGLCASHEAGIIHRDIKPDNILIDRNGRVRILDFGLAKLRGASMLTGLESTLGTAHYMSPEQARGEDVDARTDLFSLGVVFYEMIAGRRPFRGDHREAILYSISNELPQPLRRYNNAATEALESIVSKLLSKRAEARYPTAAGVRVDIQHEREATALPTTPSGPGYRIRRAGRGVLVALIILAVLWIAHKQGSQSPETVPGGRSWRESDVASIAVLPFVNMSSDAENEYFSDGLTEELSNVLARVGGLRVAARSSTFRFKGKTVDIHTIGDQLNVASILEGSVRKAGSHVRVTAQLVSVTDGFQLWSEIYERELGDIFAVQDDIARSVVAALKGTVLGKDATATRRQATDPETYSLYLRGRYSLEHRTEADTQRSADYFQQALERDPSYAPGWEGLGHAYARQANQGWLPFQEGYEEARRVLLQAIKLDANLTGAHAGLARIQRAYDWDWEAAERSNQQALALSPGDATVLRGAARLAKTLGRLDEAIELTGRAIELDPLNLVGPYLLGIYLYTAGRFDETQSAFREALALNPNIAGAHAFLSLTYLNQNKPQAALEQIKMETHAVFRLYGQAIVSHSLGHRAAADSALAELIERFAEAGPYQVAQVYAARGEVDHAFEWLERAYDQRDPGLVDVKLEPYFKNLGADPRWTSFLDKMHLSH